MPKCVTAQNFRLVYAEVQKFPEIAADWVLQMVVVLFKGAEARASAVGAYLYVCSPLGSNILKHRLGPHSQQSGQLPL
jgi:hypothetical protein